MIQHDANDASDLRGRGTSISSKSGVHWTAEDSAGIHAMEAGIFSYGLCLGRDITKWNTDGTQRGLWEEEYLGEEKEDFQGFEKKKISGKINRTPPMTFLPAVYSSIFRTFSFSCRCSLDSLNKNPDLMLYALCSLLSAFSSAGVLLHTLFTKTFHRSHICTNLFSI